MAGVCDLYPSGAQVACSDDNDCPGNEVCERLRSGRSPRWGRIGAACGQGRPCDNGLFCVVDQRGSTFALDSVARLSDEVVLSTSHVWSATASICLEDEKILLAPVPGDPCNGGYNCGSGFCVSDGADSFALNPAEMTMTASRRRMPRSQTGAAPACRKENPNRARARARARAGTWSRTSLRMRLRLG